MKRLISFSIFLLLIILAVWARSRTALISEPAVSRTAQVTQF